VVDASAILVGGDPGIGKSTLLLQAAARFARNGMNVIYVSGEEAAEQIRMRATRLGLSESPVRLAAETNLRDILTTLDKERPKLAIIDSIQTMWSDQVDSAPGSVSQVRAASHELVTFAKRTGTAIVIVGWSSIWSTPCSISRASAGISFASCARSRTASARRTRSACSR